MNDNGTELTTFCTREKFKIMDSYFDQVDGDFGTWRCNRNKNKGYGAALDHILVGKSLWAEVEHCGVYIPMVRWNTDHRMVELDLGRVEEERMSADNEKGPEEGQESAATMERRHRKAFNKYVLWCKLELDPDGGLQRISGTLDQMINKAKTEMLQNQEGEGIEWEKDTISNAESLLKVLNDAVTETIAELFPDGVPASKQRKGRQWNSKNRVIKALYKERETAIRALENGKANGMQIRDIQYLTDKIARKQRIIRKSLQQSRDQYWGEVAEKLEEAYGRKDIKEYYKLIKEAVGQHDTGTPGATGPTYEDGGGESEDHHFRGAGGAMGPALHSSVQSTRRSGRKHRGLSPSPTGN